MTVSISRMSIAYYLSTVAAGDGTTSKGPGKFTSYYTESGDPPGTWFGAGLAAAGLATGHEVTQRDAVSVYEQMVHPRTGHRLGRRPMRKTKAPARAKTPKGKSASKNREAVSGFDLTFSVPKSISVLWAMADAPTQEKIHTAHQKAVRSCLEWAEQHVIQSRAGDGGVVKTPVEGLIASLFDHFDSRDGDPQLHTHAVLSNRLRRVSDGAWVTLDSYTLHRWVVALSEMYNAAVYDNLSLHIGAVAEQRDPLESGTGVTNSDRNRRVELEDVPDELIEEFSSRSRVINARADQLISAWKSSHDAASPPAHVIHKLRQQATLETRTSKPAEKLPLSSRVQMWRQQCIDKDYLPREITAKATGHITTTYTSEDFHQDAVEELSSHALRRAVLKHPTFTRANVDAAVHRMLATTRFADHDQRMLVTQRITDAALEAAVALTPDRHRLDHLTQPGLRLREHSVFSSPKTAAFTTTKMMEIEKTLMDACTDKSGVGLDSGQRAHDILAEYRTAKGYGLAADQLEAAENVVTDPSTISAVIGPAGTGKTTTLAGVRAAWEDQHGKGSVIGLAPSAAAAQVLGQELDVPTDNVTKWLYETVGDGAALRAQRHREQAQTLATLESEHAADPSNPRLLSRIDATRTRIAATIAEQSKYSLKKGQVLIVDEASMASTTDLHQLHAQVRNAGAKMLLIGDPRQLEAVDAGGFLGWTEETRLAHRLTSVWRFNNRWEATNSLLLREGRAAALQTLAHHDRITVADDPLEAAYSAWRDDTDNGRSSVLIAGRNDAVHALNQRAQSDRIESGVIDTSSSVLIRHNDFAYLGDTILARTNNRKLVDETGSFIKNGTRMNVTEISPSHVVATREDTGASITLPIDYAKQSVELGYAATAHRAQGITVDSSHVAVDETFGREQLYVGLTRGRDLNMIHIAPPPEQDEAEKADPWGMMRQAVPESLMGQLKGILDKTNLDKTAHQVQDAEHGWAHDLGRYLAEAEYVTNVAATRRVYGWVSEHLGEDPHEMAGTELITEAVTLCRVHDIDLENVIPAHTNSLDEALKVLRQVAETSPLAASQDDLMPRSAHTSDEERTALETITTAAKQRVQQVLHVNEEQPWVQEARAEYPNALAAIVQWRAISGQDDAPTALGEEPPKNARRLTAIYRRLTDILDHTESKDVADLLANIDDTWYDQMVEEAAAEVAAAEPPSPQSQDRHMPSRPSAESATAGMDAQ